MANGRTVNVLGPAGWATAAESLARS